MHYTLLIESVRAGSEFDDGIDGVLALLIEIGDAQAASVPSDGNIVDIESIDDTGALRTSAQDADTAEHQIGVPKQWRVVQRRTTLGRSTLYGLQQCDLAVGPPNQSSLSRRHAEIQLRQQVRTGAGIVHS